MSVYITRTALPFTHTTSVKMADEKSKLKFVYESSEEDYDSYDSDEYEDDDDDALDLPLDKLNLGPQKKLLVLCLGGLLVHRVHLRNKSSVRGLLPDFTHGRFLVFKRPFCTEFLKFCFQRFEVALWSSAVDHNIDGVLTNITGGMKDKLLFVWGQDECTDSGFRCLDKKSKPLFLKQLKDLWESKPFKGRYSASNTLLIDDEPHVSLLNPPYTAIFPDPYKNHDSGDTFLGPNGELQKFLDGLADAEDVPSYVKDHPIGQSAITPAHPDWSFYGNIVRSLGKKDVESSNEGSSK